MDRIDIDVASRLVKNLVSDLEKNPPKPVDSNKVEKDNLFTIILMGFVKVLAWREQFHTWVKTLHWSVAAVVMLGVIAGWSILWAVVFPPMLILYWGGLAISWGFIGLVYAYGVVPRGFRSSPEQV